MRLFWVHSPGGTLAQVRVCHSNMFLIRAVRTVADQGDIDQRAAHLPPATVSQSASPLALAGDSGARAKGASAGALADCSRRYLFTPLHPPALIGGPFFLKADASGKPDVKKMRKILRQLTKSFQVGYTTVLSPGHLVYESGSQELRAQYFTRSASNLSTGRPGTRSSTKQADQGRHICAEVVKKVGRLSACFCLSCTPLDSLISSFSHPTFPTRLTCLGCSSQH